MFTMDKLSLLFQVGIGFVISPVVNESSLPTKQHTPVYSLDGRYLNDPTCTGEFWCRCSGCV